ncbi:hypothetical protein [Mucilaginibacter psychrotolerans]|uniref:DUF4398 domain-containing protein n=1 Tax=Mucilaginibacter psychrotolerans TaxID=1524096 RepID=A0A4Y8S9L3_9SPHI|nr:hypothetical protein [Mucilaginibacter psychrotolerans]TFF35773.1 hypothetical protein E2R66_17805 [Mucilaginibacter psychrotolerans]
MKLKYFIILSLLIFCAKASAQTGSDTSAAIDGTIAKPIPSPAPARVKPPISGITQGTKHVSGKARKRLQYSTTDKKSQVITDDDDNSLEDSVILAAYRKAQVAYYLAMEKRNIDNQRTYDAVSAHYLWALSNRQAVMNRQQSNGVVIFVLVLILVSSGLVFSAIQFYITLKSVKERAAVKRRLKGESNAEPAPEDKLLSNSGFDQATFKASLTGVEVSSSVLGVIILTISLAFFYLYLTNVFKIVNLDQVKIETSAPQ